MTERSKITSLIVIELLILLTTLAIFFCSDWGIQANRIDVISLLFVIIAELVLFSALVVIVLDYARAFNISAFSTVSVLYFLFTLIMVFMRDSYYDEVTRYSMHQAVGIVALCVLFLLFYLAASKIKTSDDALAVKFAFMQDIESRLMQLKSDSKCSDYRSELEQLCEDAHYSDKTVFGDIDKDIDSSLKELETLFSSAEEEEKIKSVLTELKDLFAKRKHGRAINSRGSF